MKIYNAKKTKPIIPPKDKINSPKKNKIMELFNFVNRYYMN